jgi:hypothetical protein
MFVFRQFDWKSGRQGDDEHRRGRLVRSMQISMKSLVVGSAHCASSGMQSRVDARLVQAANRSVQERVLLLLTRHRRGG